MNESVSNSRSGRRLLELDSLRGIAALGVVFWHYRGHFHAQPLAGVFEAFYRSGLYAVDFFFVLSGLVLARAYATEDRSGRFAENIVKRIARMYPLHVVTLVLVASGQVLLTQSLGERSFIASHNDTYHLALNLGFAHFVGFQSGFSFNAPSWSISTEFWINVLFFIVIATRRNLLLPASLAIVAVSFAIVVNTGNGSLVFANTVAHPVVTLVRTALGFFVGVALHETFFLDRHVEERRSVAFDFGFCLVLAVLYFGAVGRLQLHPHIEMLSVILGFPALLVCASQGEWVRRILRAKPLLYLGDVSYSVYLVHFPLQLLIHILIVVGWLRLDFGSVWVLISFLVLTLTVASVSYHTVELPLQRAINEWWRARAANR